MKHVWFTIALILVLTIPLFAQMAFTQRGTIPVTNGTFSYAELKSVEGTERIVVYSQDTDNIYLTISDTDGNVLETMSLAMTDSTDARKMSYFEYEETPYLVVNWVELGERIYQGSDWVRYDDLISEIHCIESLECIDTHIITTYISYKDWESYRYFTLSLLQPTTIEGNDEAILYCPFYLNRNYHSYEAHNHYSSNTISTLLGITSFSSFDTIYSTQFYSGLDIVSCSMGGHSIIATGLEYGSYDYDSARSGSTSIERNIRTDSVVVISSTLDFEEGSYASERYLLLSDNYPDEPNSFTMLSYEHNSERNYDMFFSEREMNGNELWSTSSTSFDTEDFEDGYCASCCFTDILNTPFTIYFAPESNKYEIRNRTNGNVVAHGATAFVPINIERYEDEVLIFLAPVDNGVQVWHGACSVVFSDIPKPTARNYPNPFNPTTTIGYSIPVSGHVELNIYNTRGQRVKTLVNDYRDAGEHEITWNGDNDMGETVSSGVYLYRLECAGKASSGRMLLLK